MNSEKLLSIITISFNDLAGLQRTELSIFEGLSEDARRRLEWIVVDGGSKDGSKAFLSSNHNVACFVSEPDRGVYDAMNKGTALASGTFVSYMNSGDIFLDIGTCLSSVSQLGDEDILLCDAVFNYGSYKRTRRARPFSSIWHSIPANHQSIIFRRRCLPVAPYDTSLKICGDYALLANLYVRGAKAKKANFHLAEFAVGGSSTFKGWTLLHEAKAVQQNVLNLKALPLSFSYLRRSLNICATLILYRIFGA